MVGKSMFTSKSIFMYSPHRDKGLNTSKEKIKKGGIGN
jgi:hypothetical protein